MSACTSHGQYCVQEDEVIAQGIPNFMHNSTIIHKFVVLGHHICEEAEYIQIPPHNPPSDSANYATEPLEQQNRDTIRIHIAPLTKTNTSGNTILSLYCKTTNGTSWTPTSCRTEVPTEFRVHAQLLTNSPPWLLLSDAKGEKRAPEQNCPKTNPRNPPSTSLPMPSIHPSLKSTRPKTKEKRIHHRYSPLQDQARGNLRAVTANPSASH